jgi:hypothetical protein
MREISVDRDGVDPNASETARAKSATSGDLDRRLDRSEVVEIALAKALEAATAAQRWDVVMEIARQLEACRLLARDDVAVLVPLAFANRATLTRDAYAQ